MKQLVYIATVVMSQPRGSDGRLLNYLSKIINHYDG